MNYIVAWQINTGGNSDGLAIPSGFTVVCMIACPRAVNNGVDFAEVEVQVCTFKDNTFSDLVNVNDDLVAQGFVAKGNVKTYVITSSNLNNSVRTLVKNQIRPDLDSAYGAANVVEL